MKNFLILLASVLNGLTAFSQTTPIICGTKTDKLPKEVLNQMRLSSSLSQARIVEGPMLVCRLSVDIDSDTYLSYDKDTIAIARKVLQNVQLISALYEKQINVRLIVTRLKIWKDYEPDPYRGQNDIYNLLNKVATQYIPDMNFDKHIYLYSKPVTGGATGVAYIGGIFNISPLDYYPTLIHELAHNFGSPHTNNCSWPGGPLDYCAPIEGDCYDKSLETNYYGSFLSSCLLNTSENNFHPQVGAVMRQHAENNFSKIESIPSAPVLAKNIQMSRGDILIWPPSLTAKSYQVSYASSADFSDEVIETTPFNGFVTYKLAHGKTFYVRVKAANSFGLSAWSNSIQLTMNSETPDLPDIVSPKNNVILSAGKNVPLSFSKVAGATGYQVQISVDFDQDFTYPFKLYVSQNQAIFTPPNEGGYKWRVKAVKGTLEGSWSPISYFSINRALNRGLYMPIPDNLENVALTLPFSYSPVYYAPKISVTIADSENSTNPIFSKTYTPFEQVSDVARDLPPNKKLYFRIRESNGERDFFPDADLVDYTLAFSTGGAKFPKGITFLNEINQTIFGTTDPKVVLSDKHVWLEKINDGYVKINQEDLTYKVYNRSSTDGLIAVGSQSESIRADRNMEVAFLNRSGNNQLRQIKILQDVPAENAVVDQIPFQSYLSGFVPEKKLYWSQHEIHRLSENGLNRLKSFSSDNFITQVQVLNNQVWMLVNNYDKNISEIVVFDINTPSSTKSWNVSTVQGLKSRISQIEVDDDGKLWVMHREPNSNTNSTGMFDGLTWKFFNNPEEYTVGALSPSVKGAMHMLAVGKESRIFKFNGSTWVKTELSIPLKNFGNALSVDKNDNFWITSPFGITKLTACPPVPALIGVQQDVYDGEAVELKASNCVSGSLWSWKNEITEIKDSLIANGNSLKLTMKLKTQFQVRCAGKNCAQNDTTFSVNVKPVITNVSAGQEDSQITIYPNPSAEKIMINRPKLIKTGSQYYLSDLRGTVVRAFQITKATIELDISNLDPGVYIIWTKRGNYRLSQKFTKQ
jgi:hypothetical protein